MLREPDDFWSIGYGRGQYRPQRHRQAIVVAAILAALAIISVRIMH